MDDEDYIAYVKARWTSLVRAAVLLGGSRPEAEDVVQTALIRCYLSWDKVQRADSPDAYVYRVLVNCFSKSRRRHWWGELPTADLPEPRMELNGPDLADDAVTKATVRAALAELSEPHRTVVVLRFFADLSEREVADIVGVPVGTVKSRLSRALDQLSRHLEPSDLP
ncbi:MAG: SigE family RNA polymerase sigma factor, partial [Nocardioidaceae bacterium]